MWPRADAQRYILLYSACGLSRKVILGAFPDGLEYEGFRKKELDVVVLPILRR